MAIELLEPFDIVAEFDASLPKCDARVIMTMRFLNQLLRKLNELVKVVNKMQAMMNSKLPSGVEHNLQEQPNDPE